LLEKNKDSIVMNKKHLVVLSGAGISAESGLRTFRDSDGLWMGYNIEDVATPRAFKKNPQLVLDFYNMRRRDVASASPNAAHLGLAQLEESYQVTIVTQNIDDLHERAGSTNILHLHGEIFKMRSEKNENLISEIREDINLGDLATDGAQLRPHIVWFEEPVPLIEDAAAIMNTADIFVLIGTSLQVYPAAGLIHYLKDETPKYVIDKKIPPTGNIKNLTCIEKSATEGIGELLRILI
jgi:NAD-dependent deacetylase